MGLGQGRPPQAHLDIWRDGTVSIRGVQVVGGRQLSKSSSYTPTHGVRIYFTPFWGSCKLQCPGKDWITVLQHEQEFTGVPICFSFPPFPIFPMTHAQDYNSTRTWKEEAREKGMVCEDLIPYLYDLATFLLKPCMGP